MSYTIFKTSEWEELICPTHHIRLTYKHENDELVLKCDWCDYTLVPLHDKDGKCKICEN